MVSIAPAVGLFAVVVTGVLFGPLGLLLREQPTLRAAVEAFAHYARLLNEALFLTLEESGEVVVLREELIVGHAGSVRQSTELAIGVAFQTRPEIGFTIGSTTCRSFWYHEAPRMSAAWI